MLRWTWRWRLGQDGAVAGSGVVHLPMLNGIEPARAQPLRLARRGQVGHVVGDGVEHQIDGHAGQVCTDAVVRATTAKAHVWVRVTHYVEAEGIFEDLFVEVRRAIHHSCTAPTAPGTG